MPLSPGQTVHVTSNYIDEHSGVSLQGWSGRVVAIHPVEQLLTIEWDSPTLMRIPDAYIRQSLDEGYDYFQYDIEEDQVKAIEPRDSPREVQEIQKELRQRYFDYEMYAGPAYPFSEYDRSAFRTGLLLPQSFEGWQRYLSRKLSFPFQAKVVEGGRRMGETLDVLAVEDWDERYGVIALVRWTKGGGGEFPLCDLEAVDRDGRNHQPLQHYVIWFANR